MISSLRGRAACCFLSTALILLSSLRSATAEDVRQHYYGGVYSGTLKLSSIEDYSLADCIAKKHRAVKYRVEAFDNGDFTFADRDGHSFAVTGYGDQLLQLGRGDYGTPVDTREYLSISKISARSARITGQLVVDTDSTGTCVFTYSGKLRRRAR